MITIPVAWRTAAQSQVTTLGGRRYRLSLDWIGRIERWSFSLETEGGTVLCSTKGLALRADPLRILRYLPECPTGVLTVIDTEGDEEPTLESLGRRHVLVYFEDDGDAAEVAAGAAEAGGE